MEEREFIKVEIEKKGFNKNKNGIKENLSS